MEEKKYIITENEQKQRLDTYVASLDLKLTRSQAQRMIKENSILVNGKISKESYKTKIGDEITKVCSEKNDKHIDKNTENKCDDGWICEKELEKAKQEIENSKNQFKKNKVGL